MAAKVAIIVVNWNGERYLRSCLTSLVEQTFADREIILVDNASQDGSVKLVREAFPAVRVLRNAENVGFAAGNNIGIRQSSSDFVALINNDARAEPDWLARLVETMDADSRLGACASKMVFEWNPDMINSAGIAIDKAGIAWDWLGGQVDAGTSQQTCDVFGACAGAALYRRAMLDDIGLFDEHFFAYLEDVDLAWRARLAGWRCAYVPAAKVYHVHSGTALEGSAFKNYLLGRNKIWTIVKNYPYPDIVWLAPAIILYDLASALYAGFGGDWSPMRGRIAALRGLSEVLARRKGIHRRRRASSHELGAVMEPFASPGEVLKRYQHLKTIRKPNGA